MEASDAAAAITFTDSTPEFDIFNDSDLDLAGTESPYYTDYTVTLTGAETGSSFEIACDFTLRIESPCPALDAFTSTSQTGVTDDYTGTTKYFTLTPFTVTPALCADSVTYECTGVVGPDNTTPYNYLCNSWDTDGVDGSLALTASASDKPTLPAGTYTFTITATDISGATQTSTFTWTLTDLCSSLVCPNIATQPYTIKNGAVDVDEFSSLISADCPMDFFYTVVDSAAEDAILFDSTTPKFTVFYADDLTLTTDVAPFYTDYTVTLIGKEAPPATTIECDFTLRISNPCTSLDSFTATPQTGITDDYSGNTKFFTLTPFTVEPDLCDNENIVYTCTSVTGPDGFTPFNQLCDGWDPAPVSGGNLALTANLSDFNDGSLPVGTYTFTITATGLDGQTTTGTFTWTLAEGIPCLDLDCPPLST